MKLSSADRKSLSKQIGTMVNANKNGGGISRGASLNIRWGAWFKPPKKVATKIHLIPGEYKCLDGAVHDFYQYVEVYCAATKRSYISSAKYELNERGFLEKVDGEDLGYDIFRQEIDEGVERDHRSVSVRLMNVFTLLHLANYHLVVVEDDDGNPKLYERGPKKGEFIMDRLPCTGDGCKLCEEQAEVVFGKRLHWSLGQGHLEQLGGFSRTIGKNCASCGGEDTIADPDADEISCESCDKPKSVSIFDCNLSIKREGEGSKSTLQLERWKVAPIKEELQELAKPFTFEKVFAPDPLEVQAMFLRVKAPEQARARHARDYKG